MQLTTWRSCNVQTFECMSHCIIGELAAVDKVCKYQNMDLLGNPVASKIHCNPLQAELSTNRKIYYSTLPVQLHTHLCV